MFPCSSNRNKGCVFRLFVTLYSKFRFCRQGGRGDITAWPAQPVNKDEENNTHREHCDITFYSRCHDPATSIYSKICFPIYNFEKNQVYVIRIRDV